MNPHKESKKRSTRIARKEPDEETFSDIEDLFNEEETRTIRKPLLDWYDENQRDLPWRRSITREDESNGKKTCNELNIQNGGKDTDSRAYEVWVSEVMLQQTRVQAVIEYYNRWMLKWPTVHHLAQASLEEVNEMWAGLGYYRRGRFLFEGAKMIVAGEDEFPNTASALRKVKGIGEYTAGAIASIAFNEVVPVVDGNVVRVLARLKAISANPKERVTIKHFWKLAAQLVDPSRPGDFNQALMELGATLCTPLNPRCSSCPISSNCLAHSKSKQDKSVLVTDYPTKVVKPKQRHDFSYVCVVEILERPDKAVLNRCDGMFLLVKRPEEGLLAGLWEFPSVIFDEETELVTRREAIDKYLKTSFRLELAKTCDVVSREDVGQFVHIFTHIRRQIHVELLRVHLKGAKNDLFNDELKRSMIWKCIDNDALSSMGLTSAVRKVYSMIQKSQQNDSVPLRKRINSKKMKS